MNLNIENDPLQARSIGVTYHGNLEFDTPFMSEITPNLWLGGCRSGLLLPRHIDHLVSLYEWEHYRVKHTLKSSLTVRMFDATDEDLSGAWDIARWVESAMSSGVVLVHCQAGLNRSSLIASLALRLAGMDAADAVALLRRERSPAVLCNPTFERFALKSCEVHGLIDCLCDSNLARVPVIDRRRPGADCLADEECHGVGGDCADVCFGMDDA